MEQFKLPDVDVAAFTEGRRKDIEALAEANRIAVEGMQSLAMKQAQMMSSYVEQLRTALQQLTPSAGANPTESVQQALQKAFSNMRELAEAAQKSQSDVFDVVRTRVQQNMDELKSLVQRRK
jgi:phasin family protein